MGDYVTYQEVYAEGVPTSYTPEKVNARITKWEKIVEKLTRNTFKIYSPGELIFDGNNTKILHFNLPLVEVTSVKINNDTAELTTDDYRAYTGRAKPQDDRYNPKIVLTGDRTISVYNRNARHFLKGYDQRITASWGYVEPDNSTPQPIKDAIVWLVAKDVDGYFDQEPGGAMAVAGPLKREKTDMHEIEFAVPKDVSYLWSFLPRSVADVLAMYRAPLKLGSPDPRVALSLPDTLPNVYSY